MTTIQTEPTTPEPTPSSTPEPAAEPTTSWLEALPEDLRGEASLSKFKDVDGLAKSYLESEKAMSSRIKIPEKDDAEGWENLYGKLGRPEKAEEYAFDDIENAEVLQSEGQQEIVGRYKEAAHKAGVSNRQAAIILNEFLGMEKDLAAQRETQATANIDELKQEFGVHFEERALLGNQTMKQMSDKFGGDWDRLSEALKATGLDSSPDLVRIFSGIGRMLKQDRIYGAGGEPQAMGPMGQSEILAEINKIRAESMGDILKGTPKGQLAEEKINKLMDQLDRRG